MPPAGTTQVRKASLEDGSVYLDFYVDATNTVLGIVMHNGTQWDADLRIVVLKTGREFLVSCLAMTESDITLQNRDQFDPTDISATFGFAPRD